MKELNEETKKEIAKSRSEIKKGKFYTLSEIKKELALLKNKQKSF